MIKQLKDNTICKEWQNFFEDYCKGNIETVAINEEPSLCIDYDILDKANQELANGLVDQPWAYLFNASEAIKEIDTVNGEIHPHIRIINLPEICQIPIRAIHAKYLNRLISIEGLVTKCTVNRVKIMVGAFRCPRCGAITKVNQRDENIIREPNECAEDQGGCGRSSNNFKFISGLSEYADFQKIQVEEYFDNLIGGVQPENIVAFLLDDLVSKVYPGDKVRINGIPFLSERKRNQSILNSFDICFQVVSIEIYKQRSQEILITENEKEAILETAKDPMVYDKIEKCIAPSIYGLNVEKRALMLQLFSGLQRKLLDGTNIRGDIHILLIGDPGVAKSQLLSFISKIAPRSVFCDGKGSSAAGLTAAVTKDAFGEGQFTLEAGALVLADGGIACVDELDKMDAGDRNALHAAMEQQKVHITKAGINATLKTRCSLLASANPKDGRFDDITPVSDQINLPVTLISRFDLIFPIMDRPNPEQDKKLADHIGKLYKNQWKTETAPIFTQDFLTKYINYSKRVNPIPTDESIEKINLFYLSLRSQSDESIAITPRQLEALYRLAEASARVRLGKQVLISDAERAIEIFHYFLSKVGMDRETGHFDYDIISAGKSHSQRERMHSVFDIIQQLAKNTEMGAFKDDIIHEAEIVGIDASKVEEVLTKLTRESRLFSPKYNYYRPA